MSLRTILYKFGNGKIQQVVFLKLIQFFFHVLVFLRSSGLAKEINVLYMPMYTHMK